MNSDSSALEAESHEQVSVTLTDVVAAAGRLKEIIRHSPILESKAVSRRLGGRVLIKPEIFQLTGSFKIRGIYNFVAQLPPDKRARGLVVRSAGNLGKALALSAQLFRVPCTIMMPIDAPRAKVESIQRLGGNVSFYNRFTDDSKQLVLACERATGAVVVSRAANDAIIAGNGTVGLEIAAHCEANGITPDVALVPCGSGGLITGIGTVLKARWPSIEIIACQPEGYDRTANARTANRFNGVSGISICDALMHSTAVDRAISHVKDRLISRFVDVPDSWILPAMKVAALRLKLTTEPSGAIALAALLSRQVHLGGRTAIVVLTGANVDDKLLCRALMSPDALT